VADFAINYSIPGAPFCKRICAAQEYNIDSQTCGTCPPECSVCAEVTGTCTSCFGDLIPFMDNLVSFCECDTSYERSIPSATSC